MSRLQKVSKPPGTGVLPALVAATLRGGGPIQRDQEALPFTKAGLRRMIPEITG